MDIILLWNLNFILLSDDAGKKGVSTINSKLTNNLKLLPFVCTNFLSSKKSSKTFSNPT